VSIEVRADDEWFVVGVALIGGVSGKRIGKEGAEEQGKLCANLLRQRRRRNIKRMDDKHQGMTTST